MAGDSSLTPMMAQYRDLKARDPEALLLFRMGDFYEMFGEDAERAAPLLGLTLTTRDKGADDPVPMAGFPHPALESYLAKIVQAGLRAAVCEQVEDARQVKGRPVDRQVVRVVTPGTLTDDGLLDPRSANYLAAAVEQRGRLGLAWAELSTGEFGLTEVARRQLLDELARLRPAELLVSERSLEAPWLRLAQQAAGPFTITSRPSWDFVLEQARERLCRHFGTSTLQGFGVADDAIEVAAAGAVLSYLDETQKGLVRHLGRLTPHRPGRFVGLDDMTRRSLELSRTLREGRREGSLLQVIDRAITPMGARLLANWLNAPLTDLEEIRRRASAVEEFHGDLALRAELRAALEAVQDVERLAGRIGTGRASPRDLAGLAQTLAQLPKLKARLTARRSPRLNQLEAAIDLCDDLRSAIASALVDDPPLAVKDGGLIRDGYHPTLDELREIARGGRSQIERFETTLRKELGIPGLKISFNKVFGYYVEITHAQAHGKALPPWLIRKQTVKNAERYVTPELAEFDAKVRNAHERACALESELFTSLRDRLGADAPRLIQLGAALAQLDALLALAELAAVQGYVRPEIVDEPILEIQGGRHPVLDCVMPQGQFVPNDTALGGGHGTILLLTGPNMAGKSTYIRQVALITILAQMGGFVPARSARIGLADRVFARVGATDELGRGMSTFMVEMIETANILHNATERSLVILDEIGRGTSTFDGLSLAWSITEHLHDVTRCRTLFATHYHELVDLEATRPNLRNANVAVREQEGTIVFLHRIAPGGADQSYGIHVARLAGVPEPILERARQILEYLERQHAQDGQPPPAPLRKVKSGRLLQGSLFAALPDPLLQELRAVAIDHLSPEQARDLLRRLRELADG